MHAQKGSVSLMTSSIFCALYCAAYLALFSSLSVIVHMTCKQNKSAKDDLEDVASYLLMQDDVNPTDYKISTDTQFTQTSGQVQFTQIKVLPSLTYYPFF